MLLLIFFYSCNFCHKFVSYECTNMTLKMQFIFWVLYQIMHNRNSQKDSSISLLTVFLILLVLLVLFLLLLSIQFFGNVFLCFFNVVRVLLCIKRIESNDITYPFEIYLFIYVIEHIYVKDFSSNNNNKDRRSNQSVCNMLQNTLNPNVWTLVRLHRLSFWSTL